VTPRERVIAALNHQEPDRVPIDFGSNFCTTVNVIVYNELKRRLGISTPTYVRNVATMTAAPDLEEGFEMLRLMGGDLVCLPRYSIDGLQTMHWKPWLLKDGSECMVPVDFNPERDESGGWTFLAEGMVQYRMPKDGHYFDPVVYPLDFVQSIEELKPLLPLLEASAFFSLPDEELDQIEKRAERLYEETDFALVSDLYFFSLYQVSLQLFGYEKLYMIMASEPDFVHYWMDFLTNALDVLITRYLKRVGRYTTAVLIVDDYGQQNGPQISPKMFRELFKPCLARICGRIHEIAPDVKVLLHSCGSVYQFIPDFIEAGVDALNPIQASARDMDPAVLKREFGEDLVLWGGGVTAQTTLHHGSVEEIRAEVRYRLDTMKPGGGYVFSVDHDIQENVAPEKIEAVFRTAQEHRSYS
jgi:uroporphyrinogen decarboxylase